MEEQKNPGRNEYQYATLVFDHASEITVKVPEGKKSGILLQLDQFYMHHTSHEDHTNEPAIILTVQGLTGKTNVKGESTPILAIVDDSSADHKYKLDAASQHCGYLHPKTEDFTIKWVWPDEKPVVSDKPIVIAFTLFIEYLL